MTPRVYCGSFESENHWREDDLATLPSLPDPKSSRVVEAMDELMSVFCNAEDRLLTARRMNDAHVEYLNAIGFRFTQNTFDILSESEQHSTVPLNLFAFIRDAPCNSKVQAFLPQKAELEPFAVVPGVAEVTSRYGLDSVFPSQDVIRRVNTKSYSLHMRDLLGIRNVGVTVESAPSLLECGIKMLANGPFLIKDDYGVSGKGNLLVSQRSTLQRIVDFLLKQHKRVKFILEPLLQKDIDFSCQFHISQSGSVTIISVQHLENDGLAFGMSSTPSKDLLAKLDDVAYFALMECIGREMHVAGYFGDVCVDSMLLADGTVWPLVEINARRSMSLIKNALDGHLAKHGRVGSLTSITASHQGEIAFDDFLRVLREHGLLFEENKRAGILPLSCGTLFPAFSMHAGETFRGRLYFGVVSDSIEERAKLITSLAPVMKQSGLRVKN